MNKKRDFYRKCISIWSASCFLILALSGIALFIAPSCKTAEKTGWYFLLINKESWEIVHIFFAVLFIIAITIHLILNWKIFISYFIDKGENILKIKEAILCIIVAILLFFLSIFNLPPGSWLHRMHEIIKFSWGPACNADEPFKQ